jgi:hypothetical protein
MLIFYQVSSKRPNEQRSIVEVIRKLLYMSVPAIGRAYTTYAVHKAVIVRGHLHSSIAQEGSCFSKSRHFPAIVAGTQSHDTGRSEDIPGCCCSARVAFVISDSAFSRISALVCCRRRRPGSSCGNGNTMRHHEADSLLVADGGRCRIGCSLGKCILCRPRAVKIQHRPPTKVMNTA